MSTYTVEIDGNLEEVVAASLAELANKVRGQGKHYRVWAESGLLLIDTQFGDVYNLTNEKQWSNEL